MDIVRQTPFELHVIGFCVPGRTRHSLDIPGYTRYYTAESPEALAKGLAAVQAEVPVFDATTFTAN